MRPMQVRAVHTCSGRDHIADVTVTSETRVGCGCTRLRGYRCDGTRIELLDGACAAALHDNEYMAVAR